MAHDDDKLIINLTDRHVKKVAIYGEYLFERFIDIGDNRSAMVLENEHTNQVRFVLLTSQDASNVSSKFMKARDGSEAMNKKKICYKILGIHQTTPKTDIYGISRILKVVSMTFPLNENDASGGKNKN